MNKINNLFFTVSLAALMSGCNSEIDLVKNGTLQGREQTTIGKAIESVLGDVEWNSFETDKGVKVVEAQGWPGTDLVGRELLKNYCKNPDKYKIQFILHTDMKSFEVAYCGRGDNAGPCDGFLDYAYSNNSSYAPLEKVCKETFGEFTDSRNHITYGTVKIGSQVWLSENLNYSMDGSYCFDDDSENCEIFGRLYTWDAAMKACPEGWRLPSDDDFYTLQKFAGGLDAGLQLKSTSWFGNDTYNFSVISTGYRNTSSRYVDLGKYAFFWTSTENQYNHEQAGDFRFEKKSSMHGSFKDDKINGFSVRCIKGSQAETAQANCNKDDGCFNEKCEWICE